jgi:hypothetical protein
MEMCQIDQGSSLDWHKVSNLPTFDGLNHLETFLLEFEEVVPVQQRLLALDEALKETPARWWGTHKKNIVDWMQCRTLMAMRFSEQVEGCEVRYTGQSCLKDHVRGCEEAWSNIPQEQWVHKFINTWTQCLSIGIFKQNCASPLQIGTV